MTQSLANQFKIKYSFRLFEGPQVEFSKKYAGIMKTLMLTAFYATLIPFATIFSILGIILFFWLDKVP